MANIAAILKELQQERDRLDKAIAALGPLAGTSTGAVTSGGVNRSRRTLSAAARRRIGEAQRARWSKLRSGNSANRPGTRVMSAAARRKIAAAQRARWARMRAQQQKKAA